MRLPRQSLLRHLVLAAGGSLLLFLVSEQLSSYNDYQLAQVGIYVVALAGLSVLVGSNGQISLGNGAFMAVGAYTAGVILVHTHLPVAAAVLAAAGAGAVAGVLIGIPASRLRGPYLAGMTLALAIGLPALAIKFSSTFGGDQGLSINPLNPPGTVDPERYLAWVVLAVAVVSLILLANLGRSRFGRAFRAVRDDEVASALSGIRVARTQVLAFAVSAAAAGLAGALLGLASGIVSPGGFSVQLSVSLLAGMVLGGTGSLLGMWWGAILLVYAPQWATSVAGQLHLRSGQGANLALLFYGAILVLVMLLAPSGIQGILHRLWERVGAARTAGVRRRVGDDGILGGSAADQLSPDVPGRSSPE